MKKGLFVGISSLVCSVFAFAQDDYVIGIKGDTLRGEVKILTYDLLDRVQLNAGKKNKITYTAVQVRQVRMNGETYQPQRHENAIRFMKLVKGGYVSLFLFRPANQMTYDGRFLVKMDGKSMEVPNLGFKKLISNFVEDCPEVAFKVKEEQLKRSDLDQILDEYNACIANKGNSPAIAATPVAPAATNPRTEAIKTLQAKVAALDNLADKKDVLDLLADISDKASKQQKIANYQLEALKGYLSENESVKTELEQVITLLKSN